MSFNLKAVASSGKQAHRNSCEAGFMEKGDSSGHMKGGEELSFKGK